jgi:hypothetical protein
VHVYLGRRCEGLAAADVRSVAACEAFLRQAASGLDSQLRMLAMVHPLGRWAPMDSGAHALHLRKFLNPSLSRLLSGARRSLGMAGFDESRSIRANCLRSDLDAFTAGGGGEPSSLLYFDGHYHAIFVMRELPRGTRPGMLMPVLDAVNRGASITLCIRPLPVGGEIDRLRREIDELSAFLSDRRAAGVENDIRLRHGRIDSLLSSVTIPFNLLFVVRVWADTPEGIAAKSLAMRTALQGIDGAEFMQVNNAAQARHLFYETIPGTSGAPTGAGTSTSRTTTWPTSCRFPRRSRAPRGGPGALRQPGAGASSACASSPPTGRPSIRSSSASTDPGSPPS